MSLRMPVGQQQWEGFHVLCRPLELGGVDRRLFGILMIFFLVFWQGFGLFLYGLLATGGLYYFFRWLTKRDPQFFSVLRMSSRYPAAWYDEARAPTDFGPYVAPNLRVVRDLERSASVARRRAASKSLLFRLRRVIVELLEARAPSGARSKEAS